MEKAILVSIEFKHQPRSEWHLASVSQELEELVKSTPITVLEHLTFLGENPTANLLIGSGKANEIAERCQELEADTVIFSHDLSGTQQRNLEKIIGKKTIDRTQLILDIFARHARSPEGKMQVELAQIQYLLPRLIGQGVILSRTGGGIGTSGPGETQLEVDRRKIRKRIDLLKSELRAVMSHREVIRKKRTSQEVLNIALVGYTSAGKSTLLNALTGAGQKVSGSLFTTLDPLSKSLVLPDGQKAVLSDTVGFLHDLPHHLIDAFKATFEEAMHADLLLHVIDSSHPQVYAHYKAVRDVLTDLELISKPIIPVLNKIDIVEDKTWLSKLNSDFEGAVQISAQEKTNLSDLLHAIVNLFESRMVLCEIDVPHSRVNFVNQMYKEGKVEEVKYLTQKIKVLVYLPKSVYNKLLGDNELKISVR